MENGACDGSEWFVFFFVIVVFFISVLFFFWYFVRWLCWKLWWKTRTFGPKLGGIMRQCGFIRKQCNNIFCGVAFSNMYVVRATMLSNFGNPFSYFHVRAYCLACGVFRADVDVDIDTKQMIDSDKKWYLWDTQVAEREVFLEESIQYRINILAAWRHTHYTCMWKWNSPTLKLQMKKCGQTTFNMYAHINFHIPFPGFYHEQKMLKDSWWERTSSKISARSQLAQLGIKCIYLLDEVTHIRWKGEETQNQIKSVRMGCVDVFKITRKSDYLLELVPSLTAMPIVTFFHRSKL